MIRAARLGDLEQIAALIRSSFDPDLHDYMIFAQHGINHYLAVLISMPLTGPDRALLVEADDTGQVRAFADFSTATSGDAFLSYICVSPRTQKRGYATQLIEYFLKSRAIASLSLDVFADNQRALALYKKLGFEGIGEISWLVNNMPAPEANSSLRLSNALEASAVHARYGFCRYEAEWRGSALSLGRIGRRTIRCFAREKFADTAFLSSVRALFPEAEHALFISDPSECTRSDDTFLLQKSLRMKLSTSRTGG